MDFYWVISMKQIICALSKNVFLSKRRSAKLSYLWKKNELLNLPPSLFPSCHICCISWAQISGIQLRCVWWSLCLDMMWYNTELSDNLHSAHVDLGEFSHNASIAHLEHPWQYLPEKKSTIKQISYFYARPKIRVINCFLTSLCWY